MSKDCVLCTIPGCYKADLCSLSNPDKKPKEELCPNCGGRGSTDEQLSIECEACKGSGLENPKPAESEHKELNENCTCGHSIDVHLWGTGLPEGDCDECNCHGFQEASEPLSGESCNHESNGYGRCKHCGEWWMDLFAPQPQPSMAEGDDCPRPDHEPPGRHFWGPINSDGRRWCNFCSKEDGSREVPEAIPGSKDIEGEIIQVCTDIYYDCTTIKELDRLTDKASDLLREARAEELSRLLNAKIIDEPQEEYIRERLAELRGEGE